MPHLLQDPDTHAMMIDLLEHRLEEAQHVVTTMWNTPMREAAQRYEASLQELYARAKAFPVQQGSHRRARLLREALDRRLEGGSASSLDGYGKIDAVAANAQR